MRRVTPTSSYVRLADASRLAISSGIGLTNTSIISQSVAGWAVSGAAGIVLHSRTRPVNQRAGPNMYERYPAGTGVLQVKSQLAGIRRSIAVSKLQSGCVAAKVSLFALAALASIFLLRLAGADAAGTVTSLPRAAPQVHVSGNELVNAHGVPVILRGVDRFGTEYMCTHGHTIFDGPSNQQSIAAMKSWGINAVRVPLNEACWDRESYIQPSVAGVNYRRAIERYVNLLTSNGLVVILDLHWSDGAFVNPRSRCTSPRSVCQKPMPDEHSVAFWKSVATLFEGNDAIIFDLFNEPYPERVTRGNPAAWRCWLDGGSTCAGLSYAAVGMQRLVDAVRSTGATNVIMVGGITWANDLSQWLAHEPTDPDHNLAASWHSYNFNACDSRRCWNEQIAPVAARVAVIAGEIGQDNCSDSYIDPLMKWLDAHRISYLAYAWDAWPGSCTLISSYNGTATPYGAGYEFHLQSLRRPVRRRGNDPSLAPIR